MLWNAQRFENAHGLKHRRFKLKILPNAPPGAQARHMPGGASLRTWRRIIDCRTLSAPTATAPCSWQSWAVRIFLPAAWEPFFPLSDTGQSPSWPAGCVWTPTAHRACPCARRHSPERPLSVPDRRRASAGQARPQSGRATRHNAPAGAAPARPQLPAVPIPAPAPCPAPVCAHGLAAVPAP